MIKVEIDNEIFEMVDSYSEISIGQYIDIIKLSERKDDMNSYDVNMDVVSLLCTDNKKVDSLRKKLSQFSLSNWAEFSKLFEWVEDKNILDNIDLNKKTIIVKDKEYVIINDFDSEITTGEMSAFEMIIQKRKDLIALECSFGLLLRPVKNGVKSIFTMNVFNEIMDLKYDIKLIDVYSNISFFLVGGKGFSNQTSKVFSVVKG